MVDVQLKYALWLENEGHFNEAESMFISANKPKEAVVMYLQQNNFDEALRVAEQNISDEEVVKDVLTAQARFLFDKDRGNVTTLSKVESLLLRAGRIEIAIRLYKDATMWNDAVRVCEQYAPHMLDSLRREMLTEDNGDLMYLSRRQRDSTSAHSIASTGSSLRVEANQLEQPVDFYQALKTAEQNDDKESIIRYTILLASQLLKVISLIDIVGLFVNFFPRTILLWTHSKCSITMKVHSYFRIPRNCYRESQY